MSPVLGLPDSLVFPGLLDRQVLQDQPEQLELLDLLELAVLLDQQVPLGLLVLLVLQDRLGLQEPPALPVLEIRGHTACLVPTSLQAAHRRRT